jgi:hypothetical protein
LQNRTDVLEGQWTEFVLLEKVVQILFQHFEHQAGVAFVLEALISSHKVELVCIFLAKSRQNTDLKHN